MDHYRMTRRSFVRNAAVCGAGLMGFPCILPSSALGGGGAVAPSNRITLGAKCQHPRATFVPAT